LAFFFSGRYAIRPGEAPGSMACGSKEGEFVVWFPRVRSLRVGYPWQMA
jgi:hypothetical protein